ncbi:MAG TPA: hypothetical protein VFU03_00855, partial [Gemmatimonadales bacterium]|nr:hypothetical protein [Gemmatimonadales bacterium]
VAAVVYGIVHDEVTARVCLEYFTIFHPPVFPTADPTLLGLGWGVIATWWVGLPLGIALAIAARFGSRWPKFTAAQLVRPVATTLIVVGALALVAGCWGWWQASHGSAQPPAWVASRITASRQVRFVAAWFAHSASYLFGSLGGVTLSVMTWRQRKRIPNESA